MEMSTQEMVDYCNRNAEAYGQPRASGTIDPHFAESSARYHHMGARLASLAAENERLREQHRHLMHYYETTLGAWVTDVPTDDMKNSKVFWRLTPDPAIKRTLTDDQPND